MAEIDNRGALLGALLFIGYYLMTKTPRGIRNNNPGNIRHGDNWQGMADQQSDPSFIQFVDPVYGIRAMAKIINNYQGLYGLNTVNSIIGRWAPPVENNTGAYVQSVSTALGVKPHQSLELGEYMPDLVAAIIKHENGQQPYSMQTIMQGIALA